MNDKLIWVVNKSNNDIEICILEMKKWVVFKPRKPIQLPAPIAMNYIDRYSALALCDNIEKFYQGKKIRQLLIRDAGIGDLLLLEPIIRKLGEKRDIDILTMFPDVYTNHPAIKKVIGTNNKNDISLVNFEEYQMWEDLRNYSETCSNRNKKHRTDIYNEKFKLELNDSEKEPKIYLNKEENNILKKKKDYKYIGIQCDASHSYRRYFKCKELIEFLLKQDENIKIVILGDKKKIDYKHKNVIDYQGKTNIRQAINIIKELDYMIAVDSGLMHVALTFHIPTVCIFSIITPDYRLKYYRGQYRVIWKGKDCKGCGDWHMSECKFGDIKKDASFIPPCMNFSPELIWKNLCEMNENKEKQLIYSEKIKKVNIRTTKIDNGITLCLISYNEEKNIPKFIDNVINHQAVGKVYCVDGDSKDKTVKLLEKANVKVYKHTYDKSYHDMQALQRNISFSFCRDGEKCMYMDFDECFSQELSDWLPQFIYSNIEYGLLSRRTFNYYNDAIHNTNQIKDYPDWQPRLYTWRHKYKFIKSPHHITINTPQQPIKIQKDILHFERENKNRDLLEKEWSTMWDATKEVYG